MNMLQKSYNEFSKFAQIKKNKQNKQLFLGLSVRRKQSIMGMVVLLLQSGGKILGSLTHPESMLSFRPNVGQRTEQMWARFGPDVFDISVIRR